MIESENTFGEKGGIAKNAQTVGLVLLTMKMRYVLWDTEYFPCKIRVVESENTIGEEWRIPKHAQSVGLVLFTMKRASLSNHQIFLLKQTCA